MGPSAQTSASLDFVSDLQRSYMPLREEFLREIGPEDQFILSFPRSGSRWLIRLFNDLAGATYGWVVPDFQQHLKRMQDDEVSTLAQISAAQNERCAVPDAHSLPYDASAFLQMDRPPIFRSHHLAEVLSRSSGPIVYVVREAVPVLYSYYHFARQHKAVSEDLTLEEFCRGQLPLWKDHVSTMLAARHVFPGRVLFVSYRDPGPFLKDQVQAAATHFGIPSEAGAIDWALARISALLKSLNEMPAKPHPRGVIRALYDEFPPVLRQWVEAETLELYGQAVEAERDGCLRSA